MRWLFILTTAEILLISLSKIALLQEAQTLTNAPIEARAAAYPNRIEITVKISAYKDIKIRTRFLTLKSS